MRTSPKLSAWLLGAAIGAVLLPTTAFAQASIAGVVRDTSGAVLPGVTVEASSSVLIEKVRTAVTDGSGRYRIVDLRAGTYTVTFTLPGFSDREARGHRADGLVDGGGQRRAARRRDRGNDHGHRRDADRGRAERAPAGDDQRRDARLDPHRARLRRRDAADAGHPDAGHVAGQRAGDARHDRLRHARRAQRQRGPPAGGRPGRRRGAQRRRRVGLQRRRRQRAGDHVHGVGGTRRSRSVGTDAQHRAEDRRQHGARRGVSRRRQQRHGGQQLHDELQAAGLERAGRAAEAVGLHRGRRRSRSRRTGCGTS